MGQTITDSSRSSKFVKKTKARRKRCSLLVVELVIGTLVAKGKFNKKGR